MIFFFFHIILARLIKNKKKTKKEKKRKTPQTIVWIYTDGREGAVVTVAAIQGVGDVRDHKPLT